VTEEILPILEAPHPVLSAKARPVREDEFGEALKRSLADLAETMFAAPGVGLAAPQVGDSRRMLAADLSEDDDREERRRGENLVLLVNPVVVECSSETITWEESCLSVPGFYEDVVRPRRVRVQWRDGDGGTHETAFEDFHAVVVQHEMDHLDGVTLLDRVSRLKRSRWVARRRKQREREAAEEAQM
jgi:peptide deformylase